MTSEEINGTPAVWDQGLSVRQRRLRSDQRRRTRLIAGADVVINESGADVTIYYGSDGKEERRHVEFAEGDFTHQAVARVLSVFAGVDGRLLHNADFAPALRSVLLDDARRLRDQLNANQRPHLWTVRRPWVVEWLDERAHAGYSTPYRNTIFRSTAAIRDSERLFSGEPEPDLALAGSVPLAGAGGAAEQRGEYAYVRELVAANLGPEDAKRVIGFVDRVARERGWALSVVRRVREATLFAGEPASGTSGTRTGDEADAGRRVLASATPAPPVAPDLRLEPAPPQLAAERSRGARRSGPA